MLLEMLLTTCLQASSMDIVAKPRLPSKIIATSRLHASASCECGINKMSHLVIETKIYSFENSCNYNIVVSRQFSILFP